MIVAFWPHNLSQLFSLTKVHMVGYLTGCDLLVSRKQSSPFLKSCFLLVSLSINISFNYKAAVACY